MPQSRLTVTSHAHRSNPSRAIAAAANSAPQSFALYVWKLGILPNFSQPKLK